MTQQSLAVASSIESVVKSRYNGPLIRAAAELWIGPDDLVMDVTYGKGNFWTEYQPANFIKHDLFTVDGVDFRYLPEADGSVDVVVFDPPYIAQGGRDTSTVPDFLDRYGLMDVPKNDTELEKLLLAGMTESARVLAPSGRLFMKCMDYINGGKLRLGHNRAVNVRALPRPRAGRRVHSPLRPWTATPWEGASPQPSQSQLPVHLPAPAYLEEGAMTLRTFDVGAHVVSGVPRQRIAIPVVVGHHARVGVTHRVLHVAHADARSTYVEPCLGAGSVFFAKPPVEHEILNDIDGALVTFFRALREQPDELIALCEATPYARAELEASNPSEDGLSDLEIARRWWVCVNQSFNKTGRHKNGFSNSIAAGSGEAKSTKRRLERLHQAADRLRDVVIECRPAIDIIRNFDSPTTLFYVDPPYARASRSNTGTAYRHDMDDDDHQALAEALNEATGIVMVSGYRSALYDDLFDGWHVLETQIVKRTSNRHNDKREQSTEVIWSNRPLDEGRLDFASVSAATGRAPSDEIVGASTNPQWPKGTR